MGMSTVRRTIMLTQAQNDWIKDQIESGAYANDSEVMRDLICKAQQESIELAAIRKALIDGENSGLSARGPEDIRVAVRKRKSLNG